MQTSTNFALAIIPARVYAEVPDGWLYTRLVRRRYKLAIGRVVEIDEESEHDMWRALEMAAPSAITAMASGENLFNVGIATRARLLLENSPATIETMMEGLLGQMMTISQVVLESLDARVRNKLKPRRVCPSRGLSFWEVRASASIPHLGSERETVSIRLIPSPLNNSTFRVDVAVRSKGLAHYEENQRRIKSAFDRLNSMGIVVDDIALGTALYLS